MKAFVTTTLINFYLFPLCFCSVIDSMATKSRIFGGNFAKENQFPHHAALFYFEMYHCGGSIISTKFILTAAHCLRYGDIGLQVQAGTISREFGSGQLYTVEKIFAHKDFDIHLDNREVHDIALIMLRQSLKLSTSVQPIDLESENIPVGSQVTIIGFGRYSAVSVSLSNQLKFNDEIYVLSNKGCDNRGTDTIICLEAAFNNGACVVRICVFFSTIGFFS